MKEVATQEGPQGSVTVTNSFQDYKAVGGVLFPHALEITGMAPMALTAKTTTIKVNEPIDDAKFNVN